MENTNKMKNLANDLKAFEQMMKEQRVSFRCDASETCCLFPADAHAG